MKTSAPLPTSLRTLLRASAVFDFVSLAMIVRAPGWLFEVFSHPADVDPFLFRLAALPLWMCPVVYWLAAERGGKEPGLVLASVLLRAIGAVGIAALLLWYRPEGGGAYWSFVIADLFWATSIEIFRRRNLRS